MKWTMPIVFGVLLLSVAGLAVASLEPGADPSDSNTGVVIVEGESGLETSGSGEVAGVAATETARERIARAARAERAKERTTNVIKDVKEVRKQVLENKEKISEIREAWAEVKDKCGVFSGDEFGKCIADVHKEFIKQESGSTAPLSDEKKQEYAKKVFYNVVVEQYKDEFLGRACAQYLPVTDFVRLVGEENLHLRFSDLFLKYALTAEEKAKVSDEFEATIKLESGEDVVVSTGTVLPLLLPALPKDSKLLTACVSLVRSKQGEKDGEFKEAKEEFKTAWKEFKDFAGSEEAEKNRRLGRAIEAVCKARIEASHKLALRGADAELVKNFTLYLEATCPTAVNASFEERKSILRKVNEKWHEFVKQVSSELLLDRIEAQVLKLSTVLANAKEAIQALEEKGAKPEHIAILQRAEKSAIDALAEVLPGDESLRVKVKQLEIARLKARHLVKLINAVRNRLELSEIREEGLDKVEKIAEKVPQIVVKKLKGSCSDSEGFYCRGFFISTDGVLKVSLKNKVGSEIDVSTSQCTPSHLLDSGEAAYMTCVFTGLSTGSEGSDFEYSFPVDYTVNGTAHSETIKVSGMYGHRGEGYTS